jgi:NAD(P)-dependent dehydrogenase (short-subunit alcohol dehydrogenase family)
MNGALRLDGEVALITGATSGLGKVIAKRFVAEGATVVITGRNKTRGEKVAKDLGSGAVFIAADLSEESQIETLVATALKRVGAFSIVVNNAVDNVSMNKDGPVATVSWESFLQILTVNLVSVAALCRLIVPQMVAQGRGSVVSVSSRAASRGTPHLAAYSASKGGLNALTRSMAMDYGQKGIRFNTVEAGYILHEERDRDADEHVVQRRRASQLLPLTTPEQVANAVLFLASHESGAITGVTLKVDGGSSEMRSLVVG